MNHRYSTNQKQVKLEKNYEHIKKLFTTSLPILYISTI